MEHNSSDRNRTERRRRMRVGLRWELQLGLGPETLLAMQTENLSSEGFFCVAPQAIAAGNYQCVMLVPTHAPRDRGQVLYLRCQVRVLRLEPLGNQGFGIAARIESYRR